MVEQVRGEAVAQGVGRGPQVQAGQFEVFFEHPCHAPRRQTVSEPVDEDGRRRPGLPEKRRNGPTQR